MTDKQNQGRPLSAVVLIAALLLSLSTPFLLMYKNRKNAKEAGNA